MANPTQLTTLKKAISEKTPHFWNSWRFDQMVDIPNLISAELNKQSFGTLDLSGAHLMQAKLYQSSLENTILKNADLWKANLSASILHQVQLQNASLIDAYLYQTQFDQCQLAATDFKYAKLSGTKFIQCDLSQCKNLDHVEVHGPCEIDQASLNSFSQVPKIFLQKLGFSDQEIRDLQKKQVDANQRHFPVFLSHSSKDKPFVRKLYEALVNRGIYVWMDEYEFRQGDQLMQTIDKAITDFDKLILVCSEHSLSSWWVRQELDRLIEKEKKFFNKKGKDVHLLIPITLDEQIFSWENHRAHDIITRYIGDFKNWQDPTYFEQAVNKLIDAINVDRGKDDKPPSYLNPDKNDSPPSYL